MAGTGVYRAPIQYAIGNTAPIRIAGSNDPPFRIINQETAGVVWLSNNAGLKVGEGTPLNPGTSLLWVTPSELFAISDTAGVRIILTTEIEDWQPDPAAIATAILNSGVLVVDNPVLLSTGALSELGSTPWIDISRYQSLLVSILATTLAGAPYQFATLEFSRDGVSISRQYAIEFRNVAVGNGTNAWRASVPCLGAFARLRRYSTNLTATGTLVGSNRPAYSLNQDIPLSTLAPAGPAAFYWGAIQILNAATLSIDIAPWFGEIEMHFQFLQSAAGALATSHWRWERADTAAGAFQIINLSAMTATPFATRWQGSDRIAVDGDALRLSINNAAAVGVDFNGYLRIVPVSGYGAVT